MNPLKEAVYPSPSDQAGILVFKLERLLSLSSEIVGKPEFKFTVRPPGRSWPSGWQFVELILSKSYYGHGGPDGSGTGLQVLQFDFDELELLFRVTHVQLLV